MNFTNNSKYYEILGFLRFPRNYRNKIPRFPSQLLYILIGSKFKFCATWSKIADILKYFDCALSLSLSLFTYVYSKTPINRPNVGRP